MSGLDTTQIVLTTILSIIGVVALLSVLYRMTELDDNLWIEPVIIAVVLLFIYLVGR